MNITTALLLVLALSFINKKDANIADILNENTANAINSVSKLTDKQASNEDKTGALLQILTNPTVMNIASQLFNKQSDTNGEGYKFNDNPSEESKQFFHPIDDIADAEVKHKLYWMYDHYIK